MMSKTYYSDYVRHALRFYTRNHPTKPIFNSDVDKNNWVSCDIVLSKYPVNYQKIFIDVYSGYDTLPGQVYNASKKYKIDQNIIWDRMKEVEKRIAKKRGLS